LRLLTKNLENLKELEAPHEEPGELRGASGSSRRTWGT